MPKYLVTATACRESEENAGAFAPRSFSFELSLAEPWSAKNSSPVGDLAFDQCHRAFGWWPKNNPQIDSVVEIAPAAHTVALLKILELVEGAEQNNVWDHLHIGDFMRLIPDELYSEETDGTAKTEEPTDNDIDELI